MGHDKQSATSEDERLRWHLLLGAQVCLLRPSGSLLTGGLSPSAAGPFLQPHRGGPSSRSPDFRLNSQDGFSFFLARSGFAILHFNNEHLIVQNGRLEIPGIEIY